MRCQRRRLWVLTSFDVLSDKGFYVEKDVSDCEDNGIRVFMPIPAVLSPYKSVGVPAPEFYSDKFVYNAS